MARVAQLFETDPEVAGLLKGWLEGHHWEVRSLDPARTSSEAFLAQMQAEVPHAIILSTRSDTSQHFELILQLRRTLKREQQPTIIALRREADPLDAGRAMDAGADGILTKPVPLEQLEQMLDRHAGLTEAPAEMLVRFWGVRGSIPTPGPKTVRVGGNTSCVELRTEGELIILDAGTGIRLLGLELQKEFAERPFQATLLISHTHWDHIQGFPFFAPAYKPGNHLRILGYEGSKRGLEGTLSGQMESAYFPVSLRSIPSLLEFREMQELSFQIGRVSVESTFAHHPGICMGYRLETTAGSVVYLPDHEVYSRESILQMARYEHNEGSGDLAGHAKEQDEKITSFIRDADVLIMDSQYLADEYPRYVGWGHSCVDDVVETAIAGNVKRLRLFHHDPAHDDEKLITKLNGARAVARSLGSSIEIGLAIEGEEIRLTPKA